MTTIMPTIYSTLLLGNRWFAVRIDPRLGQKSPNYDIKFLSEACLSQSDAALEIQKQPSLKFSKFVEASLTLEEPVVSICPMGKKWMPVIIYSREVCKATKNTFRTLEWAEKMARKIAESHNLTYMAAFGKPRNYDLLREQRLHENWKNFKVDWDSSLSQTKA